MVTTRKLRLLISTILFLTPLIYVTFVYSNTFYPGWEAKLNGKTVTIYMADSLVKGVIITSAGEHTLDIEYKPKSFYTGLIITSATITFTVLYILNRRKKFIT